MVFLSESVGTKSSVSQSLFLAVGSTPRGFAALIGGLRRGADVCSERFALRGGADRLQWRVVPSFPLPRAGRAVRRPKR